MPQEFVRFMPALLQVGAPLLLNVYEVDPRTRKARIIWTLGHVFQPIDLVEVLQPTRRLLVLKSEQETALRELAMAAQDSEHDEIPFWCG